MVLVILLLRIINAEASAMVMATVTMQETLLRGQIIDVVIHVAMPLLTVERLVMMEEEVAAQQIAPQP